ncbi:MAG: redoxin domain-containing protein [Deltaproteobacteria bacterium]|nr:redoxin domain-containing protein [Deltaproteobacteria bacterium]
MRPMARAALVAIAVGLLAGSAPDPRGWTAGTPAADTARVVDGHGGATIELPKSVSVKRPTLLVYFSPKCPHCRHVAAEIEALAVRIGANTDVIWVASGGSRVGEIDEFRKTYAVKSPIVHDTDAAIAGAMGARSTPSALFVAPSSKPGKVDVRDAWLPYVQGYDFLVEARVGGDPFATFKPGEYVGDNACGACHGTELKSWNLTHHSVAWWTLVDDKKQGDPACNRCHVVGAGVPGGFDGNPESHLVNVGCEACHGPGGPHDGSRQDARTSCIGCHDEAHSIAFTVEKGLPHIDHYAAAGMTPIEQQEARRKLASGNAPRPLLAFPEGANLGVATCRTCHPAEVASWEKTSHARAMETLKPEGADDPGCVRCHATALRSGPAPTTMAGFRTSESVGCESCHGPAEAHVASGAPIEGLGDDCPVCVIEAVCTTCHTPTWDPDWSLEPSLQVISHGGKR